MTLGSLQRNDLAQSRMTALTLMRVKRHLPEHLRDPGLSPAAIEQAVGIQRHVAFQPRVSRTVRDVAARMAGTAVRG